jgi:hypothetical protein
VFAVASTLPSLVAVATRWVPVPAVPAPISGVTALICATLTLWFAGRATESGVTSSLFVSAGWSVASTTRRVPALFTPELVSVAVPATWATFVLAFAGGLVVTVPETGCVTALPSTLSAVIPAMPCTVSTPVAAVPAVPLPATIHGEVPCVTAPPPPPLDAACRNVAATLPVAEPLANVVVQTSTCRMPPTTLIPTSFTPFGFVTTMVAPLEKVSAVQVPAVAQLTAPVVCVP